jgi:hypothetical protein
LETTNNNFLNLSFTMTKRLTQLLKSSYGKEDFYRFLETERNSNLILYYIKSQYITESYEFMRKEEFNKEFQELVMDNFDDFNFSYEVLSEIKKSIEVSKETEENKVTVFDLKSEVIFGKDKHNFKKVELMQKIEKNLQLNLMDPFFRFEQREEYDVFLEKNNQSILKCRDIKEILKYEDWIFNRNFNEDSKTEKIIFIEKDPITASQILYHKLLSYIRIFGMSLKDSNEELYYIHQELEELQTIKISNIKDEEKLCFFLNIFNILYLHASLYLSEVYPTTSEEFQNMLSLCNYKIDGELFSLKKIAENLTTLYKKVTVEDFPPSTVLFSLQTMFKSSLDIRPFSLQNLIHSIHLNTKTFLLENLEIDEKEIKLPNLIKELVLEQNEGNNKFKEYVRDHYNMGQFIKLKRKKSLLASIKKVKSIDKMQSKEMKKEQNLMKLNSLVEINKDSIFTDTTSKREKKENRKSLKDLFHEQVSKKDPNEKKTYRKSIKLIIDKIIEKCKVDEEDERLLEDDEKKSTNRKSVKIIKLPNKNENSFESMETNEKKDQTPILKFTSNNFEIQKDFIIKVDCDIIENSLKKSIFIKKGSSIAEAIVMVLKRIKVDESEYKSYYLRSTDSEDCFVEGYKFTDFEYFSDVHQKPFVILKLFKFDFSDNTSDNSNSDLCIDNVKDFSFEEENDKKKLYKKKSSFRKKVDPFLHYFDLNEISVIENIKDLCYIIIQKYFDKNSIDTWFQCKNFQFKDFKFFINFQ